MFKNIFRHNIIYDTFNIRGLKKTTKTVIRPIREKLKEEITKENIIKENPKVKI